MKRTRSTSLLLSQYNKYSKTTLCSHTSPSHPLAQSTHYFFCSALNIDCDILTYVCNFGNFITRFLFLTKKNKSNCESSTTTCKHHGYLEYEACIRKRVAFVMLVNTCNFRRNLCGHV